ncbi:RraA family protein [Cohnella sp. CFH 77786]|uniref:RraA family protein n=1 Tax=Cohnella sp. CFH 77786 TaxID=2662265 RepID=UPI001C608B0D|nr:RraA family protein [Cohnella sp. CFH 77786]
MEKMIDYIKRNRVSSTELADCLGKRGGVQGVSAVNRGHFRVGKVFWTCAFGGTNWNVHEQIQDVEEGDVVFVEAIDCDDKAVFGELVCKYLFLYRQAAAVVVTGKVRDVPRIMKENWPVWCTGFNPIGCSNDKPTQPLDASFVRERRETYANTIAVCDDTGVVIVPKDQMNENLLSKLEWIEEQEDIWFECIDRKKMSTFETVCLKKYLRSES